MGVGAGGTKRLGVCGSVTAQSFLPQAFSAFYYTVDFLRTVMGLPVGTLQQLEAATEIVCNQTWAEVRPAPSSPWMGRRLTTIERLKKPVRLMCVGGGLGLGELEL